MITPADVIRRIELYHEGGAMACANGAGNADATSECTPRSLALQSRAETPDSALQSRATTPRNVLLRFRPDESWDAVHTAQVAEHGKPDLVPHILREFWRVVVAGGLLFCALDTEELLARQGCESDREDPTHHCIRPLGWWHEQLAEAGWEVCSAAFEPALREHPDSFLKRYDWDWFVARRKPK